MTCYSLLHSGIALLMAVIDMCTNINHLLRTFFNVILCFAVRSYIIPLMTLFQGRRKRKLKLKVMKRKERSKEQSKTLERFQELNHFCLCYPTTECSV